MYVPDRFYQHFPLDNQPSYDLSNNQRRAFLMPIICEACNCPCDVIQVDDPCVNTAGGNLGYQPSHGESACCRAHYRVENDYGQTTNSPPPTKMDPAGAKSDLAADRCHVCGNSYSDGNHNVLKPKDAVLMFPAIGCNQTCLGWKNGVRATWNIWKGVEQKAFFHSDDESAQQAYKANRAVIKHIRNFLEENL